MSKSKEKQKEPEEIPLGELNPWSRTTKPVISESELKRKTQEQLIRPDVSKENPGPLLGIAVSNSTFTSNAFSVGGASEKSQNTQKLVVVRAMIIEQDRVPHPRQKLMYADGREIPTQEIESLFDEFVAIKEGLEPVNEGDFILIDYQNRSQRLGPKYFGLVRKGSKNAGADKSKSGSDVPKPQADLQNTTNPPSDGSPIPSIAPSPTTPSNTMAGCESLAAEQRKPGFYPVTTGGPPPPDGYEMVEMAIIPGTAIIMFPKKYMNALQAMRDAYKRETGQELGVTSGYRNIELQRCMYKNYLAKGKPFPPVGDPDKVRKKNTSVHIAGTAVDLATGKVNNAEFRRLAETPEFRQMDLENREATALQIARSGGYGSIARWLVDNSERFGFKWSGWNFKELWHYDFNITKAKELGLIE